MAITSLRPLSRSTATAVPGPLRFRGVKPAASEVFGVALLRSGRISAPQLLQALADQAPHNRLIDSLIAMRALDSATLYQLLAQHWAVGEADFSKHTPDQSLMLQIDPLICLKQGWLPWRTLGHQTVIACAYPEDFATLRPSIEARFGPCMMVIAPRHQIEMKLMAMSGADLARRAETRVPSAVSCRGYRTAPFMRLVAVSAVMLGSLFLIAPDMMILAFLGITLIIMYAQLLLKVLAVLAPPMALATPERPPIHLVPDPEPTISILVALYQESRIVARLIRRLDQLDYPRDKLDVIFVIEDNDTATAHVLAEIPLPKWLRVISVPSGTIRTKPRALNYALDHCRGTIIGVYDAEDAPAPNQLRQVAETFAAADDRLACLQGRLDYYNPHTNWLSRCFTIEYAAWWRLILPGIERLGLALPLGGTTLFFRRAALEDLGGWDAHNVTEDADLGIRIARRGYRTQLISSVTMEEANCRLLPWIKQRSRWIKGYMITWATHMRHPKTLLRDLGPRRFIGFQVMFAGSFLHALLAPLMWLLWLIPFGLVDQQLLDVPLWVLGLLTLTGIFSEAFTMGCNYKALLKTGHHILPLWLPMMLFYYIMASLAAYKALWEMLRKPFYWDKTSHGLFDI